MTRTVVDDTVDSGPVRRTPRLSLKPRVPHIAPTRTQASRYLIINGMVAVWALLLLFSAADLRDVERSLAQGDYQTALRQLSGFTPRSAHWHLLASKVHDGLNEPAKAVAEAEEALKLEPGNLQHHLQLAGIFLSRNTPQAALEILTEAQDTFPDAFLLRLGRGLALKQLQLYEQAERELLWCLSDQPASALAFDALATIYLHQSRYADALNLAGGFVERNPRDYRGYYFVAAARDGELLPSEQTKQALMQSLERNPGFAAAHALMGKILLREDRAPDAVKHLRQAIALRPDLVQAHLHLASALRKMGDEAAAVQEFEIVRELKRKEQEPVPSLLYHRGNR